MNDHLPCPVECGDEARGRNWPRKRFGRPSALTSDMIFTQLVVTEFGNLKVATAMILGTRDRTGPGRGWMRPGVEYELG